jgi:2-polyprenyl-6-methoxyphenol hydroxylase-like FAD-dependent oxidoreductase
MDNEYDAIVVGARCAGSPTAMLLARKGHRVLVLDRSTFPSDTLSTHLIHAPGIAALDRWGLLDDVLATGCPPVPTYSFDFGPFTIKGTARPTQGHTTAYAPRRTVLDEILVNGARRAGAEVREGFTVDEVVVENGTVVGIRGRDGEGRPVFERARVVIGADGRNSHVAKAVKPAQYNEKPMLQWGYYTYFSNLPTDGMETTVRPDRGFAAFATNDGLTLVVAGWPMAESKAYKADAEANFLKTLELSPSLADRLRGARREDRFYGGTSPNYFRQPFGPGWVLVGDAGYSKDPITAQGITDAFLDADRCAAALDDALEGRRTFEDAMTDFQQQRDAHAMPIYEFTTQLATLEPPPPELQHLLGAVHGNQEAMDAFASVVAGTMSPVEFFDPSHIGRIMAAATAPA